eukprot:gene11242-17292_t
MASALVVLNTKGKSLITRNYRQDVPYSVTDSFVEKVIEEDESRVKPVFNYGGHSFVWIMHNNIYFVLVSKVNANAAVLVEYLHNLVDVLQRYMDNVTEESIRDNFVVIYELLDEIMDFGHPQYTDAKLLRKHITQESHRLTLKGDDGAGAPSAMGGDPDACPWRPAGIKYSKNEVLLDVVDSLNLLMSATGEVLHSEIHGALKMKVKLSGMPELKLGLNDKALAEAENSRSKSKGKYVDLEDVKFHQCVKLNRFDADRTISFIPPDGSFDLMTYRLTTKVKPLITVECRVDKHGGSRWEYQIKAMSHFAKTSTASGVLILIPVPSDCDSPIFKTSTGQVKYVPAKDAIEWTIK